MKWIIRKDSGRSIIAECPKCHRRFSFEKRRMWKCCPLCVTVLGNDPLKKARIKIGDEVMVHGVVDEIRKDVVIVRNEGGYFGTVESEIYKAERDDDIRSKQ